MPAYILHTWLPIYPLDISTTPSLPSPSSCPLLPEPNAVDQLDQHIILEPRDDMLEHRAPLLLHRLALPLPTDPLTQRHTGKGSTRGHPEVEGVSTPE